MDMSTTGNQNQDNPISHESSEVGGLPVRDVTLEMEKVSVVSSTTTPDTVTSVEHPVLSDSESQIVESTSESYGLSSNVEQKLNTLELSSASPATNDQVTCPAMEMDEIHSTSQAEAACEDSISGLSQIESIPEPPAALGSVQEHQVEETSSASDQVEEISVADHESSCTALTGGNFDSQVTSDIPETESKVVSNTADTTDPITDSNPSENKLIETMSGVEPIQIDNTVDYSGDASQSAALDCRADDAQAMQEVSNVTSVLDQIESSGPVSQNTEIGEQGPTTALDASTISEFEEPNVVPQPTKPTSGFQNAFAAFASAALGQANTTSETDPSTDSAVTASQSKISTLQMPVDPIETDDVVSSENVGSEQLPTDTLADNHAMQTEAVPQEQSVDQTYTPDAVYFIQTTDASGEIVPTVIDPNDMASYSEHVIYKQYMGADGQIVTNIVHSGGMAIQDETQSQPAEVPADPQPEAEQQIIYAHDLNGQLTPIDSAQSANDVAPPGKQFVYMQDSSGRIIRTIMDANQTMVPGQQVYYTQSEDGRIITSVMDSESTEAASRDQQQSQQAVPDQSSAEQATAASFAMDNSMSGLNMLAELSHLQSGQQGSTDLKTPAADSSQDDDISEFRPVGMVTRKVSDEGVELVNSDMAQLKMAAGQRSQAVSESILSKLTSELEAQQPGGVSPAPVWRDNLFVQWQNLDAMCWMDVVLIMLVYSPSLQPLVNMDSSHQLASTLLITLLKANRQAQVLLQNLLQKSAANAIQTGTGNALSADGRTSRLVCKENMDEVGKAINILYAMREQIWKALQPRLRCERGKHNSPVLVLPLIAREKPIIKQMFTMNFRYVFKCNKCNYTQEDTQSKILPTIPAVPANFNMKDPCFVRNCFECKAPDQRMYMKFESLQDIVQLHFVKGLPHNRFDELSFDHNNDHYEVTAVVHYKNNPDHFIAWVRNAPAATWMECDDLKSVITRYQVAKPNIPPKEVHMVMWERRLTPKNIKVMRDTDDTKLLASLVLTVQQPGSSQPPSDTNSATTTTSAISTPAMAQGPASSILSGLVSQTQHSSNLAPYTPRGRGSRGRGRGSRGASTIRRSVASMTNQILSPGITSANSRPSGSPQIIRLPMSALQGMGAQLKGSSGTPQSRFILMGNNSGNSQSASTPGSQSKVVVVRSQGGAAGLNQLTATQLLQLLQRTGAISKGNTRIPTTITSADQTSQQQTVTLTPEGTSTSEPVTTTLLPESGTSEQVSQPEPIGQSSDNLTNAKSAEDAEVSSSADAVPTQDTPMEVDSTESQTVTSIASSEETLAVQPTATVTSSAESGVLSGTETAVSSVSESSNPSQSKVSTLNLNTALLQSLTSPSTSGAPRYIKIPDPKGGPNILTQLVVRGDKMILVPVEKSSASQSSQVAALTQTSPVTATSPAGSSSQTRYITVPGSSASGNKKTIQLISIPRGASSPAGTSTPSKTIIVGPSGQQTATRIISQSQGDSTQQASNLLVGDMKTPEGAELEDGASHSKSSTITLLKESPVKSVTSFEDKTHGLSLLSSTLNKGQESFRYILPGSNNQQVTSVQAASGVSINNKAFTALSSSGTIIGGQLTTVNADAESDVSPVESVDSAVQSIFPELDSIITPSRGRGRGRGGRGRGRGARTPRGGRGRGTQANRVTAVSMLNTDLQRINSPESNTEVIDVVGSAAAIPGYSLQTDSHVTNSANQVSQELLSPPASSNSLLYAQMTGGVDPLSDPSHNPRVITQAIPAIKANHGFDILTQGILGSISSPSSGASQRKTGISLLTGKAVSSPPTSTTSLSPDLSRMQHSLAMGHSVTQNEIDTLIQAAQGATRPPRPGQVVSEVEKSAESSQESSIPGVDNSQSEKFNVDDFLNANKTEDMAQGSESNNETSVVSMEDEPGVLESGQLTGTNGFAESEAVSETVPENEEHHKKRVFSIDESQVSAAERYRMPTELFQPDEESPEKPVRGEGLALLHGEDIPAKLFHDSDLGSKDQKPVEPPEQDISQKEEACDSEDNAHETTGDISMETDDADEVVDENSVEMVANLKENIVDESLVDPVKESPGDPIKENFGSPGVEAVSKKKKGRGKGRRQSLNNSASDVLNEDEVSVPLHESNQLDLANGVVTETDSLEKKMHLVEDKNVTHQQESEIRTDVKDVSVVKSENVTLVNLTEAKENLPPLKSPGQKRSFPEVLQKAFVPPKKQKVDWKDGAVTKSFFVFSYQHLTRARRRQSKRHPCLGPVVCSFTGLPAPLPELRGKEDIHELLTPVINRLKPKAMERPKVDPSKEPTVIPLVPEDDADPACTCGGSVVTSHKDGEVFTGVVVRQRREVADWNTVLYEEEGEVQSEVWEDVDSRQEFMEIMWTAMCMDVGVFDVFESDDECPSEVSQDCLSDSDQSMAEVEADIKGDVCSSSDALKEEMGDSNHVSPPVKDMSASNVVRSADCNVDVLDKLQASCDQSSVKSVFVESAESDSNPTNAEDSHISISPVNTITPQSSNATPKHSSSATISSPPRFNGISEKEDKKPSVISSLPFTGPVSSSCRFTTSPPFSSVTSTPATHSPVSTPSTHHRAKSLSQSQTVTSSPLPQSDTTVPSSGKGSGSPSPSFVSPARRSSRTPVPSLKVRDSFEEIPLKILSKGRRRSSVLSSDDEVSGNSSDEIAVKKKLKS